MKKYLALYAVNPNFGIGAKPRIGTLSQTHKLVMTVVANALEEVFYAMQGEQWSPHGEARELIRSLGLKHTSMSVGDVIYDVSARKYYVVDFIGFSELK